MALTDGVVLHHRELVAETHARGCVEEAREGGRHQTDEDAPNSQCLPGTRYSCTHFCLALGAIFPMLLLLKDERRSRDWSQAKVEVEVYPTFSVGPGAGAYSST
jgi:hypothetical protein